MKTESTIDTRAVVTPKAAIDSRSHTSSYKMLQNPEIKKKAKNQYTYRTIRTQYAKRQRAARREVPQLRHRQCQSNTTVPNRNLQNENVQKWPSTLAQKCIYELCKQLAVPCCLSLRCFFLTVPLVGNAQNALQFIPVTPCRIVDTRPQHGGNGPILGGTAQNFSIQGNQGGCTNIPATAAAYSLNVTVVPQGPLGYLTVWPAGQNQPLVSTMNSIDGRVKANAAIVGAGSGGQLSVFASNTTNLVLDLDGYFEATPTNDPVLAFYPLAPCRVLDTRKGQFLQGGQQYAFPVTGLCNIPPVQRRIR